MGGVQAGGGGVVCQRADRRPFERVRGDGRLVASRVWPGPCRSAVRATTATAVDEQGRPYPERVGMKQARSASDRTVPSLALRACVIPGRSGKSPRAAECRMFYFLERRLLFRPARAEQSWQDAPPEIHAEDIYLTLDRGVRVHGWWCPTPGWTPA